MAIGGQEREADLYVLKMKDFDIILGINWLSKNQAIIQYFKWKINFNKLEGPKSTFMEPRRIRDHV